jgi:hypothetical protein
MGLRPKVLTENSPCPDRIRVEVVRMATNDIVSFTSQSLKKADPKVLRTLGDVCFLAGFTSIAASIAAWGVKKGGESDAKAERFGIFIGLWAPTFFILSNRFERYADRAEEKE